MQKYVLVAFFEDVESGFEFSASEQPGVRPSTKTDELELPDGLVSAILRN
jgi:hypothetical protein